MTSDRAAVTADPSSAREQNRLPLALNRDYQCSTTGRRHKPRVLVESAKPSNQPSLRVLAAHDARAFIDMSLYEAEGAGKAGCPPHPRPPCVKNARGRNRRLRRNHSGLPCANGFNGFLRALLGDRAFLPPSSCRAPRITARLGSARHPQHLAPASGRQDHTTSPSALHLSPKPFDEPGTVPPEPWRRRMKAPLVLRAVHRSRGNLALR
jgi:hypothetical protein